MGTLLLPEVATFSPEVDSERLKTALAGQYSFIEKLRKGLQGPKIEKDVLIWILGHRDTNQRRMIKEAYQDRYNEYLIDSLQSKLSGELGKALILWMYNPDERDAKLVKEALDQTKKKFNINHLKAIVEIACASSPDHLMAVRNAYHRLFDCSVEEDITSKLSPPFSKLLEALVRSYRYDREVVDFNVAKSEAAKLHLPLKMKQLDHDHIMWILSTRNVFQLRETFKCYNEVYGIPIDQDIKSCGNGKLESILQVVISCIDSPEKYFAKVIRDSIVGPRVDEDSLTRVIVTRAETDMMVKIKEEYINMNKTTLDNEVNSGTSKDYKDFLMALLGAKI